MPALKDPRHERFAQAIAAGTPGAEAYVGAGYADTPQGRVKFRARVLDALGRVCRVYSSLRLEIEDDGVLLLPSAPHIPRIAR